MAKIPADVGSWLRELSTLLLERFLCFRRRGGRTGLDEDTNQVVHVGTKTLGKRQRDSSLPTAPPQSLLSSLFFPLHHPQ